VGGTFWPYSPSAEDEAAADWEEWPLAYPVKHELDEWAQEQRDWISRLQADQ
jgi:hypothetical protein